MGVSYSSSQISSSMPLTDISDKTIESDEQVDSLAGTSLEEVSHNEIFVLFENDNPLCYSLKFNTLFEKATTIKNKIIYNLMTTHGNTFNVRTEENTDNKNYYIVSILTRETNCLNSHDTIFQTINITSVSHLDKIQNIEDELVDRINQNNVDSLDQTEEPNNDIVSEENQDSNNLYNNDEENNEEEDKNDNKDDEDSPEYKEHKDEEDDNNENNSKKNVKTE